ncbi:glycosyltransferase family 4 protein [Nitrosococcus wardiae]|uniref:Glycosyltransferase family 1 protein n=1 Tax=Nitrosococcus wardiae TaxID=1814290 RepID=A0A4P7BWR2_9GAMM|nr:glycosyltransferase family 4 protein [Nitrosococcus wardiae]QBQ54391.1 glycosyltransferase family 1 protein [Nitrosococcus wardiae]
MSIYVFSPHSNIPYGGIRVFYRYVDILNKNGFDAYIVHDKPNFRCEWFENDTQIAYVDKIISFLRKKKSHNDVYLKWPLRKILPNDYMVIPAIHSQKLVELAKGVKKIIFNQGCYAVFSRYFFDEEKIIAPFDHEDVISAIVVSKDSYNYLNYVFPHIPIHRHFNSISLDLFSYQIKKKKQICYMPKAHTKDIRQVINILKLRSALKDFELVPIIDKSEKEVASIMKESAIFLSFSHAEGFGLPPVEAMACGCIVIGYHGQGGREYFNPEFSFPIEEGDIVTFSKTIENVILDYDLKKQCFDRKIKLARDFVEKNYSPTKEEENVLNFWNSMTKN